MSAPSWTGFELGDRAFALPAGAVEHVLAASPVTALPFAPAVIEGVASVSGDVVPVLDLARLLPSDRPAPPAGALFMVLRHAGQRFAARVERLLFIAAPLAPTDGVADWRGQPVTCLDPAMLGLGAMAPAAPPGGTPGAIASSREGRPGEGLAHADGAVLAVEAAGRSWALPSSAVVELLEQAELTALPLVPPALRGVVVLRGQPILAFCLDRLLGGAGAGSPRGQVVLSVGRSRIVLLVDAILGLQRQASHDLLDPQRLVGSEWLALAAQMPVGVERQAAGGGGRQRFLCVTLGRRTYALPLAAVERVLPARQSVVLPAGAPAGVDGAIEYGGRIVPVTEGWRWLSLAEPAPTAAYVVLQQDGEQRVLAVNGVQRIVTIARDDILPTASNDPRIAGLGSANGRSVEILSTAALLSREAA
jgi:chemotaxis signal transduction protein